MPQRRVALVTGAGGGLGTSVCRLLQETGYEVIATDRTVGALAHLDGIAGVTIAALDVTDMPSVESAAAEIRRSAGRLDLLINNAGVIGYFPVVEMDPEVVVNHFQINTFGALRTVHAFLGLLTASGGRVVNVSSESYRFRNPFQAYQTTKLALEGLSDVMRRELAPLGVGVTTVRPGAIDTDLFRAMDTITNPVPDGLLATPFDRFARGLARHRPKRVSTPDQVATVIVKAATATRMKPHYEINNMLALRLAAALPASLGDMALRRGL